MIEVTEIIKELINKMMIAGIPKEYTMAIVTNLKTKQQQKEMLDYMKRNPTANAIEVSKKANQIFKM